MNFLGLNQYWGMFSPDIMKEDGWYVYQGFDGNGKEYDLKKNTHTVDFSKPVRIASDYKSDRWRKLAENMQSRNYTFLRPCFCDYVLKDWNQRHPENKMRMLNLIFMQQISLPDYKKSKVTKNLFCLCNAH